MAVAPTTNMNGTIGSSTSNATIVTLPGPHTIVEVSISGTGGARIKKNATTAAELNSTTDTSIVGDSGYRLVLPEVGDPISTLAIYANNGETGLTYDINLIKSGRIRGASNS